MFYGPSGILIMIIAVVLGTATQGFVSSSFRRFSRAASRSGMTGAEVASRILESEGLGDVAIEPVAGELTDHFDPRGNVLRLSGPVYGTPSIAAAGVAAHEAGHAVQHARGFVFARVRNALVPAANIGSQAAFPLIFLGMFLRLGGLVDLGVWLFAAAVLFQIVTLPVEFDASRRALVALNSTGVLAEDEIGGARTVLTAAALTYVASTLVAVLYLLQFIGLSRSND